MPDKPANTIWVSSLVSHRHGGPVVQIEVPEPVVQLPVEDALQLGQHIIEVAQGAQADAFLVDFFKQELDIGPEHSAVLLQKFRQFREARVAKPHPYMSKDKGRYGG